MKDITSVIIENEGLIYKIINKYKNFFELDDLYQVAIIGLIKAYQKYQEGYNAKFTSYAYKYILGEVLKYINEFRNIKINKNFRAIYAKILQARDILSQKLMKYPTNYELSLFLELDEQLISEVIAANVAVDSLDKIILEDGKKIELYDRLGYDDQNIENYTLHEEISKLSLEEQQIITSRYYEDMSQKETGESLGMYQVEVSRKEKKILKKLYDNIAA